MIEGRVSVIIPVYNAESYIFTSVDSVLGQTYKDIEIILIDDGSQDDSALICDEYALLYSHIKVIHKQNEGPSAARNIGIANAAGEYIMFVDADDYIGSEAVESLLLPMEEYKVDLSICGYERFRGSRSILKRRLGNYSVSLVLSQQELAHLYLTPKTNLFGVAVWGKLYKKELIDKHSIAFQEKVHYEEDCRFNLQYFRHVETAAFLKSVSYHYRLQEESLSKGYKSDSWHFLVEGYQKRVAYVEELDIENGLNKLQWVFTHVIYSSCIKVFNSDLTKKEKVKCYQEIMDTRETQEIVSGNLTVKSRIKRALFFFIKKNNVRGVMFVMKSVGIRGSARSVKSRIKKALRRKNSDLVKDARDTTRNKQSAKSGFVQVEGTFEDKTSNMEIINARLGRVLD